MQSSQRPAAGYVGLAILMNFVPATLMFVVAIHCAVMKVGLDNLQIMDVATATGATIVLLVTFGVAQIWRESMIDIFLSIITLLVLMCVIAWDTVIPVPSLLSVSLGIIVCAISWQGFKYLLGIAREIDNK